MGNVTINTQEFIAVIAGSAAIVTAIWHAAMYIGKLQVRMSRVEDRLDDHDERIDRIAEIR